MYHWGLTLPHTCQVLLLVYILNVFFYNYRREDMSKANCLKGQDAKRESKVHLNQDRTATYIILVAFLLSFN